MTTIFVILGIIFFAMILKFVYDTYLTNNTERRWAALATADPIEAHTIEHNRFLNFNTDFRIKRNGVYLCYYTMKNSFGATVKMTFALAFGEKHVYFYEGKRHVSLNSNHIRILSEMAQENTETCGLSENYGWFEASQNNLRASIPDYKNETMKGPLLFEGKLVNNGLILNLYQERHFEAGEIGLQTLFTNQRFDFVPL